MVRSTATTVDRYLSELPVERRKVIGGVRNLILQHLPAGYKETNAMGVMLSPEQQSSVRKILDAARKALAGGSVAECTQSLERIAEGGQILSEVILYDPGSFESEKGREGADSVEEV